MVPTVTRAQTLAQAGRPFDAADGVRVVAYPAQLPAGGGPGSLVVATPTADTTATLRQLLRAELVLGLVALAVLGVLGSLAVTRSLRPLRRIEATAEAIAGGDLARRVPEPASAGTEVGRLSRALNGHAHADRAGLPRAGFLRGPDAPLRR